MKCVAYSTLTNHQICQKFGKKWRKSLLNLPYYTDFSMEKLPKPKITQDSGTWSVTTAATGTGRWFSCCCWCCIWYWSSRSFWCWWSPAHRYANLKFEFPANWCCSLMWCRPPQPHALTTTTTSAAQWRPPGLLQLILYAALFITYGVHERVAWSEFMGIDL